MLFLIALVLIYSTLVTSNESGCVSGWTSGDTTDYFPQQASVNHATGFTITYHNYYKVINVLGSYAQKLVLWQCGTEAPTGVSGLTDAIFVQVPITKVGITTTTLLPFLEVLGQRNKLKGTPATTDISSPCINTMLESNDAITLMSGYNINATAANFTQSEVIFTSSSTETSTAGKNIHPAPVIAVPEFSETTNRGVVEWLHFIAAFFNEENKATATLTTILNRLTCVQDTTTAAGSDAKTILSGKKVLWCSYVDYTGWGLGEGYNCGECPNYYCDAITAAGATMLEYDTILGISASSSTYLNDAQFNTVAASADIWIYPAGDFEARYNQKKSYLDQLSVVTNKQVYGTHGKGEKDWLESRILEPDVLVEDILAALATTDDNLKVNHDLVWFTPFIHHDGTFSSNTQYNKGLNCVNVTAPLDLQGDSCANLIVTHVTPATTSDEDDDKMSPALMGAIAAIVVLAVLFTGTAILSLYQGKRMSEENVPFLRLGPSSSSDGSSGSGSGGKFRGDMVGVSTDEDL